MGLLLLATEAVLTDTETMWSPRSKFRRPNVCVFVFAHSKCELTSVQVCGEEQGLTDTPPTSGPSHPQEPRTHAVTPVPGPLVSLVTEALEGAGQVLAHGVGPAEGPIPAFVHICNHQTVRPLLDPPSPPHLTQSWTDTYPGIRPLAWAGSQGHRPVCSGRSQGCSHSAGLHKSLSHILGIHPHLRKKAGWERGGESQDWIHKFPVLLPV